MWRSPLGDTRLRLAPLAELDRAKDVIILDSPKFSAPRAPDAATVINDSGALFLFKHQGLVALAVTPDGAVKLVGGG